MATVIKVLSYKPIKSKAKISQLEWDKMIDLIVEINGMRLPARAYDLTRIYFKMDGQWYRVLNGIILPS